MENLAPRPESHLGVYALIPDAHGENILLIKKGLGCYTGLYDLPGGSMEPLETTEETVSRETFEETSCSITSARQLGTFTVLHHHQKSGDNFILRHIGVIYLAEIEGIPCDGPAGDDSLGCAWVPVRDISPANAAPLVIEAVAAWQKQKAAPLPS